VPPGCWRTASSSDGGVFEAGVTPGARGSFIAVSCTPARTGVLGALAKAIVDALS